MPRAGREGRELSGLGRSHGLPPGAAGVEASEGPGSSAESAARPLLPPPPGTPIPVAAGGAAKGASSKGAGSGTPVRTREGRAAKEVLVEEKYAELSGGTASELRK